MNTDNKPLCRPAAPAAEVNRLRSQMTHTVGIFVFDNVEVLEFAGPYEVFTTASNECPTRIQNEDSGGSRLSPYAYTSSVIRGELSC
jgi:hypothetical protein